jgi:hypothetical protein
MAGRQNKLQQVQYLVAGLSNNPGTMRVVIAFFPVVTVVAAEYGDEREAGDSAQPDDLP